MPMLKLDVPETRLLRQTLEATLGSLRFEIAHTDRREFRELLHVRARMLESLIGRVAQLETADLRETDAL